MRPSDQDLQVTLHAMAVQRNRKYSELICKLVLRDDIFAERSGGQRHRSEIASLQRRHAAESLEETIRVRHVFAPHLPNYPLQGANSFTAHPIAFVVPATHRLGTLGQKPCATIVPFVLQRKEGNDTRVLATAAECPVFHGDAASASGSRLFATKLVATNT